MPTRHLLTDRGMIGDGVIDLPRLCQRVADDGYRGLCEVEIFSADAWWRQPVDVTLSTIIQRLPVLGSKEDRNENHTLTPARLLPAINRMWALSASKISAIDADFDRAQGAPVHTVAGRYQPKGWTDWTQGFEYGSALLQFDATGEQAFLDRALTRIRVDMPQHITHFGEHDHGFNQVSTYGNLLRLMAEGKLPADPGRQDYYRLALRCSGAVQAYRWTSLGAGEGYIHSFNGAHSLFIDTLRTLRVLLLAHDLGQ